MISILLSPTDSADELRDELERWLIKYDQPPAIIVGHKNLIYGLVNEPEFNSPKDTFKNIPIMTLAQVWTYTPNN